MFFKAIFFILFSLQLCYCGWISDWIAPVQDIIKQTTPIDSVELEDINVNNAGDTASTLSLKNKLEGILNNVKALDMNIKSKIFEVTKRETTLKEIIANGISGVTTVTVSTLGGRPKSYLVRNGAWTLCSGRLELPFVSAHPRCHGLEVSTSRDPCVFNSIIKYATIPTRRRQEYMEDDYLCLKPVFNSSLQQYFSVPRQIIKKTCHSGLVRSVDDNIQKCGHRIMADYTYYPDRTPASDLPLEYCTGEGVCKLIAAWSISNSTIENFEFLKDETEFKDFFIDSFYRP